MDKLHFIPNTNFFKELIKYKNDYQWYLNYIYKNYCWGLFFRPTWHYFIGNLRHIDISLIFWINLFKTQNKLILMDWAHMAHKILISRSRFMVHISSSSIGIITPRQHQHQHMDRAQAINQSSRLILPLLRSWQAASSTKAHIYAK